MTQSPVDIVAYYANLLILQYIGKPRAYATIATQVTPVIMPQTSMQTITFEPVPDSGAFVLFYGTAFTAPPINWDDSAAVIQMKLRGMTDSYIDGGDAFTSTFDNDIDGGNASTISFDNDIDGGNAFGFDFLQGIVVTGSIASGLLTITFSGVTPPALLLTLGTNTLLSGSTPVIPIIEETDETLPIAVENAYNVSGANPAAGVQLDILGKYAGVTRTGNGFTAPVTLDDADFLTLIKFAIIKNTDGSSLSQIVDLLNQFFPGEIFVTDYQTMFMTFDIALGFASDELLELVIDEGLLPVPMAVGYIIVIIDAANAFGFEFSTNSGGFGDLGDPSIGGEFASLFSPP